MGSEMSSCKTDRLAARGGVLRVLMTIDILQIISFFLVFAITQDECYKFAVSGCLSVAL